MERSGCEPMEMLAHHLGATSVSPKAKLIVLSNLHNPTSVATDEATLEDLSVPGDSQGTTVFPRVLSCEAYALCADPEIFREGLARLESALKDLGGAA